MTVLLIGLGLGLALLVQETSRWVGMLRTVFLLPLAVGLAAASLLFWGFYSDSIGPVNPLLQGVGLIDEPILFFATHTNAFLSTVFMIVWKFVGLYMLILLVGLQAIPTELYEAASIDGGGRMADLPAHHAAAAAPVTGAGADPLRDRVAAGVRPLLSPDQGRPGQLDRHRSCSSSTSRRSCARTSAPPPRCRWCCWARCWSSTSSGSACFGAGRQWHERPMRQPSMFARTPYYVLTGGLAIIFLFPLAWATIASFSAQAGSAQTSATASATTSGCSSSRRACPGTS